MIKTLLSENQIINMLIIARLNAVNLLLSLAISKAHIHVKAAWSNFFNAYIFFGYQNYNIKTLALISQAFALSGRAASPYSLHFSIKFLPFLLQSGIVYSHCQENQSSARFSFYNQNITC